MFKTIIWATDGSEAADRALSYAKTLAYGDGRTLVAVHSNELLVGRGGGWPLLANEDELQEKIRHQVDVARGEGFNASFKLVTGTATHAAHMIADVARDLGADVIVVGTRGQAAIAGLLLGSVTQRLLHIAPCPVLAVPSEKQTHARERESEMETAMS